VEYCDRNTGLAYRDAWTNDKMYHQLVIQLLTVFVAFSHVADCGRKKDTAMNNLLTISVTCKANPECLYTSDEDLFIDIKIANRHETIVGFPLEFVKDRGPIVNVSDTRTKTEINLPTHPADGDLMERFTTIEPGESVYMAWVIKPDELEQFGGKYVDVSAEITIMATILADGKKHDFRGSDTIRIVSKDKPKDPS